MRGSGTGRLCAGVHPGGEPTNAQRPSIDILYGRFLTPQRARAEENH